jgi:flagellar hook-basal body complex protein FliE
MEIPTDTSRSKTKETDESSFKELLESSLKEVNALQNKADDAISELAQGRTHDLHRTMVMIEKANLSFKLMMKVRNKLLEAYQEIMRTPS